MLFHNPDKHFRILFLLACSALLMAGSQMLHATDVRMHTDLGAVDIELLDDPADPGAPNATVDNFLDNYVNTGLYEGTFIHRRTSSAEIDGIDIMQMGGHFFVFDPDNGLIFPNNSGVFPIQRAGTVDNEPRALNLEGTVAMARVPGDANSATSEFFFNLADHPVLDNDADGAFTVFGRVTDGMDVLFAIADLERCKDILFQLAAIGGTPCAAFPNVPMVAVESDDGLQFNDPLGINNNNLVNLLRIGIDTDLDGAIDSDEDGAPNNGNGNNDAEADSVQQSVASFRASSGNYITLESTDPALLSDVEIFGRTFLNTTVDPFNPLNELAVLQVVQGTFSARLINAVPAPATNRLVVTLHGVDTPNSYFMFGPEPGNATPHWFEFADDGSTGVVIAGNTLTLNLVDGQRGDADLTENGVIVVPPGGPFVKPGDSDGIPDAIEDGHPNNGDGNGDGIPDSTQDHVVSVLDSSGSYLTLVAGDESHVFRSVQTFDALTLIASSVGGVPPFMAGLNLPYDFIDFILEGVGEHGTATVTVILPEGIRPVTYIKRGQTPDNPTPHLYDFTRIGNSGPGAVYPGDNTVILHLQDGEPGDGDITIDGKIVDPGTPALSAEVKSSTSGGGGCSLQNGAAAPWQAGAWLLLAILAGWHLLRRNLFMIIDPAVTSPAAIDRAGSSLDVSPTLLDSRDTKD